jgi:hypothetical protein
MGTTMLAPITAIVKTYSRLKYPKWLGLSFQAFWTA